MPGRILIVDDNATIRKQIIEVLRKSGNFNDFLEAEDGLSAFKLVISELPDLVVCDLVMPKFDGLKFLRLHTSYKHAHKIPVIILTAENDLNQKAEILEQGASDYITKPFHDKELLARVGVHYRLKCLQDELRDANERLEALSTKDELTGLCNRRYLERILQEENNRTVRYRTPMAAIMIDIDHFKDINDTYGHAMGDEVLRNIGKLLLEQVRALDTVARYGGEEIVVLLPHTPLEGALQLAERLREKIALLAHTNENVTIHKTASFGVAVTDGGEAAVPPAQLLQRADAALYRAKQKGRNRVEIWWDSNQELPAYRGTGTALVDALK